MTAKLAPADRRQQILEAAVSQAAKVGYANIRREAIAAAAGVSPALVNVYFSTMQQLKRDVMRAALAAVRDVAPCCAEHRAGLAIIGQGLANKDKHAAKAPEAVKRAALAALA